jgi:hypothetical protein
MPRTRPPGDGPCTARPPPENRQIIGKATIWGSVAATKGTSPAAVPGQIEGVRGHLEVSPRGRPTGGASRSIVGCAPYGEPASTREGIRRLAIAAKRRAQRLERPSPPAPSLALRATGAEEKGFEPLVPFGTAVFKTAALNHSATPPKLSSGAQGIVTDAASTRLSSILAPPPSTTCRRLPSPRARHTPT